MSRFYYSPTENYGRTFSGKLIQIEPAETTILSQIVPPGIALKDYIIIILNPE